ncbi:hypothetical protein K438DRAFT_1960145 [Mycena galopus ATCC 62051]|nr:hypothetical protein K438DRAFT_1960145 [Mycena galopus ATCC 62051]
MLSTSSEMLGMLPRSSDVSSSSRKTSRPDSTAGYRTEKGSNRLQGITTLPKLNIADHRKLRDASYISFPARGHLQRHLNHSTRYIT